MSMWLLIRAIPWVAWLKVIGCRPIGDRQTKRGRACGIRAGVGADDRGRIHFDLASFRQNRAQAAILSFAK